MGFWQDWLSELLSGKRPLSMTERRLELPELQAWSPGRIDFVWEVPCQYFDEIDGALSQGVLSVAAEQGARYAIMSVISDDTEFSLISLKTQMERPFCGRKLYISAILDRKEGMNRHVQVMFMDGEKNVYSYASAIVELRASSAASEAESCDHRKTVSTGGQPMHGEIAAQGRGSGTVVQLKNFR